MFLTKPEQIIRTTVGEYLSHPSYSGPGIYVIACYPDFGCLYIGISKNDVEYRLRNHLGSDRDLGNFLRNLMVDACGFRLDILVPPDIEDKDEWLIQAEKALIYHFSPTFNVANNSYTNAVEAYSYL